MASLYDVALVVIAWFADACASEFAQTHPRRKVTMVRTHHGAKQR